jgi:hypothetical protein
MCHAVDGIVDFVPPFCTWTPVICSAFRPWPKSRSPLLADTCSRRSQQRQESVSFNVFAKNDTYCQRGHHVVCSALTSDLCDEIHGIPSPGASQERRIGATVSLKRGMIIHHVGEQMSRDEMSASTTTTTQQALSNKTKQLLCWTSLDVVQSRSICIRRV